MMIAAVICLIISNILTFLAWRGALTVARESQKRLVVAKLSADELDDVMAAFRRVSEL